MTNSKCHNAKTYRTVNFVLGYGTAGSFFNATADSFPAVSYSRKDFNYRNCRTESGGIESYVADVEQVN